MRNLQFRVYLTYGYTAQELNDPGLSEEIQETGLGVIDTPDLIDFKNQSIKYDSEWYDKDRFELMEFTGMYDKTGKPIYEGDIVKAVSFAKWIGVVRYISEKAAFVLDEIEPSKYRDPFIFLSQFEDGFEILGNIYENENLLKIGD